MISTDHRSFAPACERNRQPILDVLKDIMPVAGKLLEVGSGTGQHAAWFAPEFPDVQWQPADLAENINSINAWRQHEGATNVLPAMVLDLSAFEWPQEEYDVIVCINTIHIVSWELVEKLFAGAGAALKPGGLLYVYGPYRYRDRPLEPSNENFDAWLKNRDPASGIRDFENVNDLAATNGLVFMDDHSMPANNRSISWIKKA